MSAPSDSNSRTAKMRAFFPSPIWTFEWEWGDLLETMAAEIKSRMEADSEGRRKTNQGGWQSRDGVWKIEAFSLLFRRVEREIHRINRDLVVGEAWANVNFPGCFNRRHVHPAAVLAGTFYLETPENCGDLVLEDPREVALMVGGLPEALTAPVRIAPRAGRLVLFPAWLPHSVEENQSKQDRISIAFNAPRVPLEIESAAQNTRPRD